MYAYACQVVHEMGELYGISTISKDNEPRKYVNLYRTARTSFPAMRISEACATEAAEVRYIYINIYIYICVCVYIYIYIYIYIHTYKYIYIYMYTYIFVYICTNI